MFAKFVRGLVLASVAAAYVAACDSRAPSSSQGFAHYISDLESIGAAISKATGYPEDHVDVSGNRTQLHISILDFKLMEADAATLEKAAAAVVAAAEQALAAHTEFASVQVIRVGIYHPTGLGAPLSQWHMEDVVEYRRGPDQRFSLHVP